MLKDVVRTKTYQNVIYRNTFLFKDKIVLDVGAVTGILSLFCAKAGAKHVYAVECSQMADMEKEIVEANGYSNAVEGLMNMKMVERMLTVVIIFGFFVVGKSEIYIITIEGEPLTSYRGGVSGFEATAVESNEKLDVTRFLFLKSL